jgi:hypothetical protein
MHHVFEVDEILRIVTSSVGYEDCKDAVSLACCCKSFSAPALDTVWGTYQRKFTWLLRTLPPSVWAIVDTTFVRSLLEELLGHARLISSPAGLCPSAFRGRMGAAYRVRSKDALFGGPGAHYTLTGNLGVVEHALLQQLHVTQAS